MRIPKYVYYLDGTVCSAVLDAKTNVVVAKDKDEQFFRKTLSGDVTFFGSDFMKIVNTPIDTRLSFVIKRYDPDNFLVTEFVGYFTKADCEIDFDNSYLTVSIKPDDVYEDFLYIIEKEHNLVDICPDTWDVTYKKKDFIQLYLAGDTKLTCLMGDNYWTQECSVITDDVELNNFGFSRVDVPYYNPGSDPYRYASLEISGGEDTTEWHGVYSNHNNDDFIYERADRKYAVVITGTTRILYKIGGDGSHLFRCDTPGNFGDFVFSGSHSGGTSGLSMNARIRNLTVYGRIVTNSEKLFGKNTTPFGDSDITADNRNYKYYTKINTVYNGSTWIDLSRINPFFQVEPSKYGKYKPTGEYYSEPAVGYPNSKFIPVCKDAWSAISVWFDYGAFTEYVHLSGEDTLLKDAYSIGGTIKALLKANESDVTFEESYEHSYFLYSPTGLDIRADNRFFITQKTNILSSGYSQAATKTPITIKQILDMLRTTMALYWFVDDQSRLRIEHISYFMNGMKLSEISGYPGVAFDMTKYVDTRTGSALTRASNKVSFDKEDIPIEIKFEYDDACSDYFIRSVISPISGFVNREKKESWSVKGFSVDVDRMIASPEEFSKDGFALLACLPLGLPDGTFALTDYGVQNHVFSLSYLLDKYLKYNLPFGSYKYNGEVYETTLRKKLMTQNVDFIYATDLDPNKLIKTQIGYGSIEKISVNLATRNNQLTLKYESK